MTPCTYDSELGYQGWPFSVASCPECPCAVSRLQIRSRSKIGTSRWCCWDLTKTTTDYYKVDCGAFGEEAEPCVSTVIELAPGPDVITAGHAGFGEEETCPNFETTEEPCDPPSGKVFCTSSYAEVNGCSPAEEIPDILIAAAAGAATFSDWTEWEDFLTYNARGMLEDAIDAEFTLATAEGGGFSAGYFGQQFIELRVLGAGTPIKVFGLIFSDAPDPEELEILVSDSTPVEVTAAMGTVIEFRCAVPVSLL